MVRLTPGFGVSERRACRIAGQHRSTQRAALRRAGPAEERPRARLREFSREHPRWGFRRAWRVLARGGCASTESACSASGARRACAFLREPASASVWARPPARGLGCSQPPRRARCGPSTSRIDQTACGRPLKLLNIVDEFSREALAIAIAVARRIDADRLLEVLDRLALSRGRPAHVRMDNGPELTAHALRDWARLGATATSHIEPGSPWENPYVESFNGRLPDELLNQEQFDSLLEAQVLVEAWRIEYNTIRPHSALGGLIPRPPVDDPTPALITAGPVNGAAFSGRHHPSSLLREIEEYNAEDCVSTYELREWLLGLRREAEPEFEQPIPWAAVREMAEPPDAEAAAGRTSCARPPSPTAPSATPPPTRSPTSPPARRKQGGVRSGRRSRARRSGSGRSPPRSRSRSCSASQREPLARPGGSRRSARARSGTPCCSEFWAVYSIRISPI